MTITQLQDLELSGTALRADAIISRTQAERILVELANVVVTD